MKKLILLISLFILPIAHAGLFEDDEARRAILEDRKSTRLNSSHT